MKRISWIRLVQAFWTVLFLLAGVLNLSSFLVRSSHLGSVCQAQPCAEYQVTAEQARLIVASGMSVETYQGIRLGYIVLSTVIWSGVGLFLFWVKRRDPLALFVSISLVTFGSAAFGLLGDPSIYPGTLLPLLGRLVFIAGQVGSIFFFTFPNGRFYPRWTAWVAVIWTAGLLPLIVFPNYQPLTLYTPLFFLYIASVILAQVLRYRQVNDPVQRQQVKWVIYSIILAFTYFIFYLVFSFLTASLNSSFLNLSGDLLLYTVMAFIPISVAMAILRYRLWDIDLLIRRTVLYALLTGFLGLLYYAGVVLLQQVFRLVTGQESAAAVVVTTLFIAALFSPLRQIFQSAIDRRFYRQKYDAERTLEGFSRAIRNEVDFETLSERLVGVAEESLQPEQVSLWMFTRR